MLSALAEKLESDIQAMMPQSEFSCIVDPTLIIPQNPYLKLSIRSHGIEVKEEQNWADRTFDGKTYKGRWIDVYVPLDAMLYVEGNENAIKTIIYDLSFQIATYFRSDESPVDMGFSFPDLADLHWDGALVVRLAGKSQELINNRINPDVAKEAAFDFSYTEVYEGQIYFRYFDLETETGRYGLPLGFNEEASNINQV